MNNKQLTRKKIREMKQEVGALRKEKYKIGYKVLQKKDWFGRKKGRTGWVINEWPKTIILFDDGLETHMSNSLDDCLESTGEVSDDLVSLINSFLNISPQ